MGGKGATHKNLDRPQDDPWRRRNECSFQITTEPAAVREFLDADSALPKVIFSTYHSSPVIKAALREGEAFDLAIFDEATKPLAGSNATSRWP